jgi:hypothetical protein
MPGKSVLVLNPVKLAEVLRSPTGPVFRHMVEDGEKVKTEARRLAPVGKPDPLGRPKSDGTPNGHLRDNIVKRVKQEPKGMTVLVGVFTVPYAYWVHEGAPPHTITAKKANYLVFMGSEGVVFTKTVNHPGNKPNQFLKRALSVIHS